jgi:predicted ribosome quality control (RQC) complex YloA/Tae2 family protein
MMDLQSGGGGGNITNESSSSCLDPPEDEEGGTFDEKTVGFDPPEEYIDETSNDKNDDSSSIYFNTVPYLIPRVHFADHVESLNSYYPSKQSNQLNSNYVKQQQQLLKQQNQVLNDYRIKFLKRILVVVSIC